MWVFACPKNANNKKEEEKEQIYMGLAALYGSGPKQKPVPDMAHLM